MNAILKSVSEAQLRDDVPEFEAGDTVRVHVRVVEGEKERIQLLRVWSSSAEDRAFTRHLRFAKLARAASA